MPLPLLSLCLALGSTLGFSALASSQSPPEMAPEADRAPDFPPLDPVRFGPLPARVRKFELENGWRFLVLPRPDAPVVSFETYVPVGAADEPPSETGLAHFFEHLAFKGSDRIGTREPEAEARTLERVDSLAARVSDLRSQVALGEASEEEWEQAKLAFAKAREEARAYVLEGEFSALLEEAGGARTLNATTSVDETRYVVSLPRNRVETWCWLESERFLRPVLREFYSEREAVLEERRTRIDEAPFGRLLEVLAAEAFQAGPYGHPALGSAEDVLSLTRPQADEFFTRHYVPQRMVTAIVGDVDPDQLLPLLERYFGRVPGAPSELAAAQEASYSSSREVLSLNPAEIPPRRATVHFPDQSILAVAWHVPRLAHADSAAVEMTVRLLGHARSSRLEQRLVRDRGLLERVIVLPAWPGDRFDHLSLIVALPSQDRTLDEIESAVLAEVENLKSEGPTSGELLAAKRVVRAEKWKQLQTSPGLAAALAEYESRFGNWREAFLRIERLEAVTASDVQRVLKKYFGENGRILLTMNPPEEVNR